MGIFMSLPLLACCACQTVMCTCSMISCCFESNPGINFTAAKVFYVILLGLSTLLAFVLKFTGADWSRDMGPFSVSIGCVNSSFQAGYNYSMYGANAQAYCVGDGAVYRVGLALALFYLFMAFMSLAGDTAFKGFWFFKLFCYGAAMVGCFFIPEVAFAHGIYQGIARFASVVFLVLQLLILIDFGYVWNEGWVAKAYEGAESDAPTSKVWLILILISAFLLFVGFLTVAIVLFVLFGNNPQCTSDQAIVSVTFILVFIATFLALFRDKIVGQEGALLPSAVVALYAIYLSWSALQSNPNPVCRLKSSESSSSAFLGVLIAAFSLMWTSLHATKDTEYLLRGNEPEDSSANAIVTPGAPETQLYRVDDNGKTKVVSDLESNKANAPTEAEKAQEQAKSDGNSENIKLFFVLMVVATLYMSMLLTNWGEPSNDINGQTGEASMWAKAVSAWVSVLFYIWTLIAPCVCRGRAFA